MPYETVCNQVFDSKPADQDHSRVAYCPKIAEVEATTHPDGLLTFNAVEGWAPSCDFLEAPVPDEPFLWTNSTQGFKAMVAANARSSYSLGCSVESVLLWVTRNNFCNSWCGR